MSADPFIQEASSTVENKRDLILKHAKATFARKGFEGTRISDIAKSANIGKGTIYEYFRSKSEILMATCEAICRDNLSGLEDGVTALKNSKEANPAKLLHFTLITMVEKICYNTDHLKLFMELWKELQNDQDRFSDFKDRLMAPYQVFESFLTELVQSGIKQGVFRVDADPRQITFLVSSSMDGLVWQYSFRKDLGPYREPHALADAILSILKPMGA